jgi:AraC-like DNA-binding protein
MADVNAVGRILVWPGGSLWIGRSTATTSTHIHHAIQITLVLEGSARLRTPSDATWTEYQGAVVPSHLHHTFSTSDAVTAIIFVEPETPEGHALLDRFGSDGIRSIPEALHREAAATMADAYQDLQDDARLISAAQEVTDILTSGVKRRVAVDSRILSAIELIRTRLQNPIVQDEIAEAVFLSPSRFRHLFVEETGMAFRPYVLWLRLQKALECLSAGVPPTSAAIDAGFSDTAHMTRTFSRMFGITPGLLAQKPERKISRFVQGE